MLRSSIAQALILVLAPFAASTATVAQVPSTDRLSGNFRPVHDPAIIKAGDTYHLFTTGNLGDREGLIGWRTSRDLKIWTLEKPVFAAIPDWAKAAIPATRGLWAPDIVKVGDEYRLYYSVSAFGKNTSAIGLATTPTLDRTAPGFGWIDKGMVWQSRASDDYNAIDPNIFVAADGRQWMAFGSFWSGIKLIAIDPSTGKPPAGATLVALVQRKKPDAVEGAFLIARGGWHYLFASYDFCCRGVDSTYYTVVGRAKDVAGPYLDRDGTPMMKGGGLLVLHADLEPGRKYAGPGHPAILRAPDGDRIVYHAYDRTAGGAPTLRIQRIGWTPDGWPVAY